MRVRVNKPCGVKLSRGGQKVNLFRSIKIRLSGVPGGSSGGGGIPSNSVLYEDGTPVFYEDGNYLMYE